jgi:hypothetical protein
MMDSGHFGFPLVEFVKSQDRLVVSYFPLALSAFDPQVGARTDRLFACIRARGALKHCRDLAVVWYNASLAPPADPRPPVLDVV